MNKIYLGDSVYADFDGFHVVLTTENGDGSTGNRICLDPDVIYALKRYIDIVHESAPVDFLDDRNTSPPRPDRGMEEAATQGEAMTFSDVVKEMGFEDEPEFNRLVASVDLSSPKKVQTFHRWKSGDGSKTGLITLLRSNGGRHE